MHHADGVFYAFEEDPAVIFADVHEDGRYLFPGKSSCALLSVTAAAACSQWAAVGTTVATLPRRGVPFWNHLPTFRSGPESP
jgi:acetoin utilization deacetylase AcuC-like enzyme